MLKPPVETAAFWIAFILLETAIPMIVPNKLWAGIAMLLVAIPLLASAFGLVPPVSRALSWKYSLPIFVVMGASLGVCAWATAMRYVRGSDGVGAQRTENRTVPAAVEQVPITVRYQLLGGLPITVPANSTLYILQIYPAKDQLPWFFQFTNPADKVAFWPKEKVKPQEQVGFITRCEVINLGEAPVINVTLDFSIQYKREISDPNHPNQTTSGPTLATGIRRAMIGLLQPNVPFTFYIVNQSPFFVDATPPTTATFQIAGKAEIERAALVQPQASVEDLFALHLSFFPSRYPWTGLPPLAIQ